MKQTKNKKKMILNKEEEVNKYLGKVGQHQPNAEKHFEAGIDCALNILLPNLKCMLEKSFDAGRGKYTYKNGKVLNGFSTFEDYWEGVEK